MSNNTIEKRIILDAINPTELYGINNIFLNQIKSFMPELSIVARGDELILKGQISDISKIERVISDMITILDRKGALNQNDIEHIFEGFSTGKDIETDGNRNGNIAENVIVYGNDGRIVRARTKNQIKLVSEYQKNDLLFAIGPAGTGKTYTSIALAVKALREKEVRKLILTRPAVEAGERLGFLPGDMKDKLDPYLQPLYDALRDMIQPKKLQSLMEDGTIQIAPLAYMRGRTLDSAFVILDEAQNTTLGQLKMFLTRMGNNAKFIVTGDPTQIDLPNRNDSGLLKGVDLVKNIKGISVITFDKEDIVRHPLVTKIVQAFTGDTPQ